MIEIVSIKHAKWAFQKENIEIINSKHEAIVSRKKTTESHEKHNTTDSTVIDVPL